MLPHFSQREVFTAFYSCEENKPSAFCLLVIASPNGYPSFTSVSANQLKFSVMSEPISSTCFFKKKSVNVMGNLCSTYTQQIKHKNIILEILSKEAVLL